MTAMATRRPMTTENHTRIKVGPKRRSQLLTFFAFYWRLRRQEYRWLWEEALSITLSATLVLLVALGISLLKG